MTETVPRRLGFRMPAEWAPHEATWIAWPHNRADWPGRFAPIPWVYGEIVRKLSHVEKVRILVASATEERQARRILRKVGAAMEAVEFFECPTDRVWTRDYAPLFVRNRKGVIAATKWRFNSWTKYPNHKQDDAAGRHAAKRSGVETWAIDMVLEGGSVDVNGEGLLLTT
ncbi:MAG TPA: agmatine deiminase family protein, partial [Bryobacteraceae bacterium]|nr:agmatine deiminase family protein [Bryobacteraceae bacterium]